jgi:hypothetical protein
VGAFEFGLGLGQLGLIAALVDHEQQVALVHFLAFLEGDTFDITADARTQVDGFDRADAAGELVPLAHRLVQHLGDADFRRRRGGIGLGLAGATGHDEHDQQPRGQREEGNPGSGSDLCFRGSHGTRVPGCD